MNYRRRIVCVASSWKHAGRCIAGKEVLPSEYGQWVRPVNARPKAGVSDEERQCTDGSFAGPLDILDISFEQPVPELHQTENHRIDPGLRWVKTGQLPAARLEALLDHPEQLWLNGSSSGHGLNDRVSATAAAELNGSLALIDPEDPFILMQEEDDASLRVRMEFVYRGVPYNFSVTDPSLMRAFRSKPRGRYPLAPSWLCVSLGERFDDGYCYKLAAAVHGRPS